MEKCRYLLPCGMCDKFNEPCCLSAGEPIISPAKVTHIPEEGRTREILDSTSISSQLRTCGSCPDGMKNYLYLTHPPKIKCKVTGNFRFVDDVCDCDTLTAGGTDNG